MGQGELHVSRTRGHVYEQIVEFAPNHVVDEILDHLRNHGAAPNDWFFFFGKHGHGDDFDAVDHYRMQFLVVVEHRSLAHLEHHGLRRAVNVRVQHPYPGAGLGESHRDIGRGGGLADAAFSRGDGQDMPDVLQVFGALTADGGFLHLGGHIHRHRGDSGNGIHFFQALGPQIFFDGAGGSSELDVEAHFAALDFQVFNEAQFHDILMEVGIADLGQCL